MDKTNELMRRLANAERIIHLLFEQPNTGMILEKKLVQFEEMIALFPDSAKDMADEARAKVVSMWLRVSNSASCLQKNSSESGDSGQESMPESKEDVKDNSGSKNDSENNFAASDKIKPKNEETLSKHPQRPQRPIEFFSIAPRPELINFCKYCKSCDHVRDQCPVIKNLLCFRCYQSGHTKRGCMFGRRY